MTVAAEVSDMLRRQPRRAIASTRSHWPAPIFIAAMADVTPTWSEMR